MIGSCEGKYGKKAINCGKSDLLKNCIVIGTAAIMDTEID